MRNDHKTVGFAWFITQYITDQKVQGQTGMKHLLKHQTRSYMILRILFSENRNYKTEQRKNKSWQSDLVFNPFKVTDFKYKCFNFIFTKLIITIYYNKFF